MASDDFDLAEINRLVSELNAPPKRPAPAPVIQQNPALAATTATEPAAMTPGRRWTNARLLMPAERKAPRNRLAFLDKIKLPVLPRIPVPAVATLQAESVWPRAFVGLGVLLSAAMAYWPYSHAWSWGLLFYFVAMMLNLVTGIWGAKLTWDARMPAAHTVAVGTVIWGIGLLASEAVPRIVAA